MIIKIYVYINLLISILPNEHNYFLDLEKIAVYVPWSNGKNACVMWHVTVLNSQIHNWSKQV